MSSTLHVIYLIWTCTMLLIATGIVFVYIKQYLKETGTWWERSVAAFRDSTTLLWSYFQIVVLALINGLVAFAQFIREPELASVIQQYLTPQVVAFIMIATTAITIWARTRRMSKDPV